MERAAQAVEPVAVPVARVEPEVQAAALVVRVAPVEVQPQRRPPHPARPGPRVVVRVAFVYHFNQGARKLRLVTVEFLFAVSG